MPESFRPPLPPPPDGAWHGPIPQQVEEAWERHGLPGPWVFTCEHATARVPPPLHTQPEDLPWLRSHWGLDVGVRTLTLELLRRLGGGALLSRFSRLVCDPNRAPDHQDLVRIEVEGRVLSFNEHLSPEEVQRRIATYHQPYHQACSRLAAEARAAHGDRARLVSVHSFTPIWNMHIRPMDIGVLFDRDEADAVRLAAALEDEDFVVALNEPYSGKDGLIYSAALHGEAHDLPYVELELNQVFISTPERALRVGARVARALQRAYGS